MKQLIAVLAGLIFTCYSHALVVTIEPDDYAIGTNLTHISPYVTLTSTGGADVFAADVIHRVAAPDQIAAEGYSTQVLGNKAFSTDPLLNSEWFYWPDVYPNHFDPDGLKITFSQPVTDVSFLQAELFGDSTAGIDPLTLEIYDENGILIDNSTLHTITYAQTYLGPYSDNPPGATYEYYLELITISGISISQIVIGGESEPTTLDRLQFTVNPVPVPASAWLFISAITGLIGCARRSTN